MRDVRRSQLAGSHQLHDRLPVLQPRLEVPTRRQTFDIAEPVERQRQGGDDQRHVALPGAEHDADDEPPERTERDDVKRELDQDVCHGPTEVQVYSPAIGHLKGNVKQAQRGRERDEGTVLRRPRRPHRAHLGRSHLFSSRIFGPKTRKPITAAPAAASSTAPAATSLAFSAMGWKFGDATSVRNSNAVLRASAVQTETMARTIQHHSGSERPSTNPADTTMTDAAA